MAFLPPDVPAWDDASNNRWPISGRGAMIMNPPSAWAVAKRDAPQIAEQCWTHGFPVGPKGRFAPFLPFFWSTWNFSKNKEAAKTLLVHLSQPSSVEALVRASGGYDLPAFEKLTTFKIWAEEGPPKGTLYHYPNPFKHQILSISASPAPPKIAQQIYAQAPLTKMCVRYFQGQAMESTLSWGRRRARRLHAELRRRPTDAEWTCSGEGRHAPSPHPSNSSGLECPLDPAARRQPWLVSQSDQMALPSLERRAGKPACAPR
jgi:hypothetical protein